MIQLRKFCVLANPGMGKTHSSEISNYCKRQELDYILSIHSSKKQFIQQYVVVFADVLLVSIGEACDLEL